MKFIFDHRSRKSVYCIRAPKVKRDLEIIVMPAKGKGYHLYPKAGDLAATLLRSAGASGMAGERIAALLAATPLLQREPPWETCESALRLFCDAAEAFR